MARLLTSGELAKELGVSLRTVHRWIADGLIEPEFRTPGGHTRWNVEAVRERLRSADQDH
ncbi:helix-turn-helix domain-containing protein [Pseudonocardia ailaonensis]|uniref:helix-turn-helix domain-containing protein n=1 Tax=Pseudonocardia ailaonensis TaxID=367279 RepID=UPI0031D2C5BF